MNPFVSVDVLDGLAGPLRYGVLVLLSFVENVVPWLPGDLAGLSAAVLVARGRMHALPTVLSIALGSWLGFLVFYESARLFRRAGAAGPLGVLRRQRGLRRFNGLLHRYGGWLVLAHRFCLGGRTAIAFGAGLVLPRRTQMWLSAAAGSILWSALLVVAVGRGAMELTDVLARHELATAIAAGGVLVAAVLGGALLLHWRRTGRTALRVAGDGGELAHEPDLAERPAGPM